MGSWKMCLVSKSGIFNFHDYGRKSNYCNYDDDHDGGHEEHEQKLMMMMVMMMMMVPLRIERISLKKTSPICL